MGRWTILTRKDTCGHSAREGGYSLIELTITLCLLMAIALFGVKTMISGSMMQNWAIAQSMTDAYAGIETSIAQRYVFADILGQVTGVQHWGVGYTPPATAVGTTPTTVTI